jgi:tetratricopeptide (TPR) repeat protein
LENFALCCWKASKKDSALILMSELYANNKINPIVLAIEVDFMLKLGDKEKAKSYLTKFKQIAPSDPKILKLSGIITEIEGNQNAAIQMYEAAFKGDPTDLETTLKLGDFFIEQRLWSKAISLFRSSLKYHPNESMLQEKLGTLLISCPDLKLQSIEEGLELSERAYFHISCTSTTLLSAAKNLALGNAMLGNFQTANSYMLITLNIAKSEKVSKDYMDVLLLLESEIKQSSKK